MLRRWKKKGDKEKYKVPSYEELKRYSERLSRFSLYFSVTVLILEVVLLIFK